MQAMMAAGQALQVFGTIAGGNEADKVAGRNANIMDRQADTVRQTTQGREEILRQRTARTLSDQRAALLANGVDTSTGTAAIGIAQNTYDAELDALTLRYEGLMQAQGINDQAKLVRREGKMAKKQSRVSAAGQLLEAGSSYLGSKQPKAPVETREIKYIEGRR